MAVKMAALVRSKNGEFFARKGIPADVRDAYARLYNVRWEAQFKLPANTSQREAKTRHGEWLAEIETRNATLRATANGHGHPHAPTSREIPSDPNCHPRSTSAAISHSRANLDGLLWDAFCIGRARPLPRCSRCHAGTRAPKRSPTRPLTLVSSIDPSGCSWVRREALEQGGGWTGGSYEHTWASRKPR
jgi:hypothetical protein